MNIIYTYFINASNSELSFDCNISIYENTDNELEIIQNSHEAQTLLPQNDNNNSMLKTQYITHITETIYRLIKNKNKFRRNVIYEIDIPAYELGLNKALTFEEVIAITGLTLIINADITFYEQYKLFIYIKKTKSITNIFKSKNTQQQKNIRNHLDIIWKVYTSCLFTYFNENNNNIILNDMILEDYSQILNKYKSNILRDKNINGMKSIYKKNIENYCNNLSLFHEYINTSRHSTMCTKINSENHKNNINSAS